MSIRKILIVDDGPPVDLLDLMREAILRPLVYHEPCLVLNRAETKMLRKAGYKGKIITTKPFTGRFIASKRRGKPRP